jgi:hypothetical protein
MSSGRTTAQLIKVAAREHLEPMGLHPGPSRLWFEDRGWWLLVVCFARARNPGTRLLIGANWLWKEVPAVWTFDEGDRLWWRSDGSFTNDVPLGEPGWSDFIDYRKPEWFADDTDRLARIAVQRVQQLREQFATLSAAAGQLTSRRTRIGESEFWHRYHSGAAAALSGDTETARHYFGAITTDSLSVEWEIELADRAAELRELDDGALRAALSGTINNQRRKFNLPPAGPF